MQSKTCLVISGFDRKLNRVWKRGIPQITYLGTFLCSPVDILDDTCGCLDLLVSN